MTDSFILNEGNPCKETSKEEKKSDPKQMFRVDTDLAGVVGGHRIFLKQVQ